MKRYQNYWVIRAIANGLKTGSFKPGRVMATWPEHSARTINNVLLIATSGPHFAYTMKHYLERFHSKSAWYVVKID